MPGVFNLPRVPSTCTLRTCYESEHRFLIGKFSQTRRWQDWAQGDQSLGHMDSHLVTGLCSSLRMYWPSTQAKQKSRWGGSGLWPQEQMAPELLQLRRQTWASKESPAGDI